MNGLGLLKRAYDSALAVPVLERPLTAVRGNEHVRRFLRRRVHGLLAPGSSWADVERALRLIGEDGSARVAFGAWPGSIGLELLYWIPFLRWAVRYAGLPPERTTVASQLSGRGWYAGIAAESPPQASDPSRITVDPDLLVSLCKPYWEGRGGYRPIRHHAAHERLAGPDGSSESRSETVVVDLGHTASFPDTDANRALTAAARGGANTRRVESGHDADALRAIVSDAGGVVTTSLDTAALSLMLGRPTILLHGTGTPPDPVHLGTARWVAYELESSFTVVDAEQMASLVDILCLRGAT